MITENLFLVVGPLRTGSSLMTRCLDDHPQLICLCESEINRALFPDYFVQLHFDRMRHHGLQAEQIVRLLNQRKQDSIEHLIAWYRDCQSQVARVMEKPDIQAFGDKSPDFFTDPRLVSHLAASFPLIYTVRDPRAIYCSIVSQTDATQSQKAERWENLSKNFLAWEERLDQGNILVVRYEDLIASPEITMNAVYGHIGLAPSRRFLEPFPRLFPQRFLWNTNVDPETGIRRDFDPSRIDRWKASLTSTDLDRIRHEEIICRFMQRFGYEW